MSTNLLAPATTMTPQVLQSGYLGTSDAAIYTVPSVSSCVIGTGVICNQSGSAVTVYLDVVPTGGSAGASHRIINAWSLAAGDTLSLTPYIGGQMMTAGDFIGGYASTGTAVVLVLTGTVNS